MSIAPPDNRSSGAAQPARRIRMVEHFAVPVGDSELQIRTARRTSSLRGVTVREILPLLMPLLDGTLTEPEIATRLEGRVEPAKVRGVLKVLFEKGLLEEVPTPPAHLSPEVVAEFESVDRYYAQQSGAHYQVLAALRQARVLLVHASPATTACAAALLRCGVGAITLLGDERVEAGALEDPILEGAEAGQPRAQVAAERLQALHPSATIAADLALPSTVEQWRDRLAGFSGAAILVNGPALFHPLLPVFNRAALAAHVPWTTLAFVGERAVQIGPTVSPGVTACHACLVAHFQYQTSLLDVCAPFARARAEAAAPGPAPIRPLADLGANLLAVELTRAISPGQAALSFGRVISLDLDSFASSPYGVPKQPRCRVCGPTRDSPPMRIWS